MRPNAPSKKQKINVVIPVFNEEKTIRKVLNSLVDKPWISTIIVVDDGSTDGSANIIKTFPVKYLKNHTNQGSGYSTIRGLRYSANQRITKFTATMDADRQHTAKDLYALYKVVNKNTQRNYIVHAVRNISQDAPFFKKITTRGAWSILSFLYGPIIEDPFCGLNIYRNDIIPMLKFSKGYDWPISLLVHLQQIRNYVTLVRVPAHYSKYSLSKGMTFKTSLIVFSKIILSRVKEFFYEKNIGNNKPLLPADWRD